ncbi:MAG: fibronectin type III domain-containing protein [candidate division KSB1 bacterium]|nr:fibronectin type III domain-containing protein [candidate division KSB1 bacterium]
MAQGKTLGEAFQADLTRFIEIYEANGYSSTVWCPNWGDNSSKERLSQRFYSAILLGDPTLRINRDNRADNLPPIIDSVQTRELTQTSATITWRTDEPADSRVEYGTTIGYGQSSPPQTALVNSHTVQLIGLTPGTTYHFRVHSSDAAGNTGVSEDFVFTTPGDATPPVLSQITVTALTTQTATITWQTDEPADTQVEWGVSPAYGQRSPLDTSLTTDHRVQITGLTPNTTYHFRVKSRDASGNLAASADHTFTTPPDTTPPVIQNVLVQTPEPTRAVISWQTDEAANAQVEFGTTPAYGNTRSSAAGYQTIHQIELSGLLPNTLYHYRIRSRDRYGNTALTDDRTFVTPPDTVPPVLQNIRIENIGLYSADVAWETNEPADARVQWGTTRQYGNAIVDTNRQTAHRLTLTGLDSDTQYHVRILARDAYGNEASSGNLTFRTMADQQPPRIKQLRIARVAPGTVTLAWQTDEPATAAVHYGPTPALESQMQSSLPPGLSHQIQLIDLQNGEQYHFAAEATDQSGNVTRSQPIDMMIPSEFPDFSLVLEAERMARRQGSNADTPGVWTLFPGNTVADSFQVPFDDTYHFWVKLQADSAAAGRRLQCHVDGVLQREFVINSERPGYVAFRTFLARGWHKIVLAIPASASGPVQVDYIEVQSRQARMIQPLSFKFVRVDSISETQAVIQWSTSVPARAILRYGEAGSLTDSMVIRDDALEHTWGISGLRPDTRYAVQIAASDSLGRTALSELIAFTTLADRRPPELVEVHALNVGSDFAVITWRTDEEARASIEYGEDEGLGRSGPVHTAFVSESADTLHGLLPDTHYFYRIALQDQAGNKSVSPILEFLTHPMPAPGPAVIVLQAETMAVRTGGRLTDDGAGWRFTERGYVADSIRVRADGAYTILVQARGSRVDGQWPLVSLTLDGSPFAQMQIQSENYQTYRTEIYFMAGAYELGLHYNNPASGTNTPLLEVDWMKVQPKNAQVDREAPQITAIQIEAVDASTALIRWWTSETAHGTLEFGHNRHLGRVSRERTRSTRLHEIVLSNLSYDIRHFFRIRTWDSQGNATVSEIQNFVLSEVVSDVETEKPGPSGAPPTQFQILSHHPNPVRRQSTIRLHFPDMGQLQLKVYDILGREVAHLFSGNVNQGVMEILWDLSSPLWRHALKSGVYFLHARFRHRNGGHAVLTRRMLLLK